MDTDKVIQDLNRRFAAPLPEFYSRRIIFWHDEDREFDDKLEEIHLDNAKLVILTGSNNFEVKKLLSSDKTSNYLVYDPISFEKPDDNWLLDIELYSEDFRADLISIWMDDVRISSATVNSAITEGQGMIEGNFTAGEAAALASKINAGALPFKLTTTNSGSIDPTLGATALQAMAIAGVIALLLVCVFMLVLYRVPGFIACFALLGQVAMSLAAVSGFFNFIPSFTMTLPGVAGIILSIGMGVDANIITSERIKEELRAGKTLDGSIANGSKNSFSAIFDGNITVIIVAVILMAVFGPSNILSKFFGMSTTGTIYSFGYTLLIGVIGNFVMGVTASRLMLSSFSGNKFARNKWLYGGSAQ